MTAANHCLRHISALVMVLAAALLGPNGPRPTDELCETTDGYSTTKPPDAVAELEAKSASALRWTGGGRLILQTFEGCAFQSSQVWYFPKRVFSALPSIKASPGHYFSDNCYVGWCRMANRGHTIIWLGPYFTALIPTQSSRILSG
jgi:hypothetical protein